MKTKGTVQISSVAGPVDAPLYFEWEHSVLGASLKFALHVAAGHAKGFQAPLAISEMSTGFDVKAVMLHPNSRNPLTDVSAAKLSSSQVKKLARAALHRLIYKQVGPVMFLDAIVGGQMRLAKMHLSGDKTPAAEQALKVLDAEFAKSAALAERSAGIAMQVIMPKGSSCLACEDSRVLTTTDKDHEGQPIEVACTECIPKPVCESLRYAESPTEDEWFETLTKEAKLEHLVQKRDQTVQSLQLLRTTATKADYDRIDGMEDELTMLNEFIDELQGPAPDLQLLKDRLEALHEIADQHGTMTGDTNERDYEELRENIDSLEKEIADMEAACSVTK